MKIYSGDAKARMISHLKTGKTGLVGAVSTKKMIYQTFADFNPEFDVDVEEVDELHDNVTMSFGSECVHLEFIWQDRNADYPSYTSFKKYRLSDVR